jgi:hypothetical protein
MANYAKNQGSQSGSSKKSAKRIILALTGVAGVGGVILWLAGFFSTPKEVLEIRAIVDAEVARLDKVARNEVPFSEEWSQVGEVFGRMRDMPESVRDDARREVSRLFRARERAELASYFALPPNERTTELDRRIKADQARREAGERERASRAAAAGGNGGLGQGRQAGQGGPRGGPNGGGNGGGPPGGGPPGQRNGWTDEQILARRKGRLDQSSPEERARSAEYRRAMAVRRAQLGISPGRGRGA